MRCLFFRVNRRLRFFIPFRIHRISGESQIPKRINLSARARVCIISPSPLAKHEIDFMRSEERRKKKARIYTHKRERKKKEKWAAAVNHEERTLMQDRVGERSRLAHVQTKKKFERNRIKDLFLNALRRPTMNQGIKGGRKNLWRGRRGNARKAHLHFYFAREREVKKSNFRHEASLF